MSWAASGDVETAIRAAAFAFLERVAQRSGGFVRHNDVSEFEYEGQRIPLLDRQRGIRKPTMLRGALSFRTVYARTPDERPYADEAGPDGFERYKWRGTDPKHPENVAMRVAMEERLPLIWFRGVADGVYVPVFPVWLADDEPGATQFVVALDEVQLRDWNTTGNVAEIARYGAQVVKTRLHQPLFRARVLLAYERRCALCRLRHAELLDAAHIRPDAAGGLPTVTNGIAMCKLHHAAFDSDFVGITPNYKIAVRADIRIEADGPTLQHSIQALHNEPLVLPRRKSATPDREALEYRYERFRAAG